MGLHKNCIVIEIINITEFTNLHVWQDEESSLVLQEAQVP